MTEQTPFNELLDAQISNEFAASQQYIAVAVYYDSIDMPQMAQLFYAQAVEERNHAMMIVQYFLDRDMEVEIFAHGRLPLAYSARCFTARHYNLQKDSCEFRCLEFADGIPLKTREGAPFLTLNGIQTQSAHVHTLLADLPAVVADGLDILRISPQGEHTGQVIQLFPFL